MISKIAPLTNPRTGTAKLLQVGIHLVRNPNSDGSLNGQQPGSLRFWLYRSRIRDDFLN